MPTPLFAIPLWIDLVAVAIGAIQGAMFAGRFTDRRMDLLGISIIGITVGLGGGLLRDILLGGVPAALLSNWYLPVAAAFALLGMALQSLFNRLGPLIITLDAVTIGLFGVIGTTKALAAGLPEIPALFVGVVSAVGGSVLRDMMLNVPIAVMHVGSLYAVAALVGCGLLVGLVVLQVQITVAALICVVATTVIRVLAARFGWSLPQQRAIGSWPHWRRRGSIPPFRAWPRRRRVTATTSPTETTPVTDPAGP
ncbi:trimeric intracellular cation channel family protein [Cryobacterium sp. PAMC25264]|uniref:trimeric intracellular cation channel family protein n=1 Tax=Cryobacterium sp. PAMC25264 TaxID=2861288 RepID=UPI001C625C04|nr:TRIC cation channel family protein [Cryobacterium sp. PAMC25264]QYF74785.1 TRIC cation channel family protein [Cryobacterium sp. PAMC25264]